MAFFTASWTPAAVPNVTGQIFKYRITGDTTWLTSGITPNNPLSNTQNTATVTGLLNNTRYDFQVDSTCAVGGPTPTPVMQKIVYACIGGISTGQNGNNSVTITVAGLNTLTHLNFVRFFIYSGTNTLVQVSPNVSISNPTTWTTNVLTAGTYFVRVQYGSIIDGVQEFSQFGENTCRYNFTVTI